LKQFTVKHFDKILMAIILLVAIAGTYLIEEKSVVLDFYYLPVLFSAYFFGRRLGILTAVTSILVVFDRGLLSPGGLRESQMILQGITQLLSWSGFLILSAAAVGTLYEKHERRLQDLKNAYIGILEILSKYLESTDRYTKATRSAYQNWHGNCHGYGIAETHCENIRVAGYCMISERSKSAGRF